MSLIKVGVFFAIWALLWSPAAIALVAKLQIEPGKPPSPEQKLPLLASLYLLAPIAVGGGLWSEGITWGECGLFASQSTLIWLGAGIAGALISLAIAWGVQVGLGWQQWHPERTRGRLSLLLSTLGLGVAIGFVEELVFRGYLWQLLRADYQAGLAAAIASVIFALSHLLWERTSTVPQLPGLALMGAVLAIARIVAGGNLGLPWGLHAGWVWGLSAMASAGALVETGKVPKWVTNADQPLASAAGWLSLLVAAIALVAGNTLFSSR